MSGEVIQSTEQERKHESLSELQQRRDDLDGRIAEQRALLDDLLAAQKNLVRKIQAHPERSASFSNGVSAAEAQPSEALESLDMIAHAFSIFGRSGLGFRTIPQLLSYSKDRIQSGLIEYFKRMQEPDPQRSAEDAIAYLESALSDKGFELQN